MGASEKTPLSLVADNEPPQRIPPERNRGGVWVTFGGEAYRIPPLSLRQIQDLAPKVEQLGEMRKGGATTGDQMAIASDVIWQGIQRNYPSVTLDQVIDMVDLGNVWTALNALMAVSGFERRPEGAAPGETAASTGMPRTPS